MTIWLQVKVLYVELGLRPRLYAAFVCVDSAAEATYAALIDESYLLLYLYFFIVTGVDTEKLVY